MRYRIIDIKDMNGNVLEFYPADIIHVKIEEDNIQIKLSEGQLYPIKVIKLLRDNFDYCQWGGFVSKLERIFEL